MKKQIWILVAILVILIGFGQTAQAVLQSVGPRDIPSPPGNGFPLWYQDTNGLTLDLCLPRNQVQLDAGVCLITPPAPGPPPVPGFNLPLVFPDNFPDEAFWYASDAIMNLSAAPDRARLVLAVEAAFAAGAVIPGDQVSFGRLRIIIDAPVNGNYTVTTPYGVKVFPNVIAGPRAITFTSDIGIGAPGDFSGALLSEIGPFLRASASEGGAPLPPITIPGDTSGDLFIGDAATPGFITGSPDNTNYFEVCLDPGQTFPLTGTQCIRQNQFTLMGRVFNGTPFVVKKSYYIRDAAGAGTVNVFGLTSSVSATAAYEVSGSGLTSTFMTRQIATGNLFASIPFATGTVLPASVTVTATDPPHAATTLNSDLVDLVVVTSALYDAAAQTLTINAASSDQAVPPTLTATGFGALVNGVLTVNNRVAPPETVTVTSSRGGTGTATVIPGVGLPPAAPRAARNDFDGDGKSDIAIWRPSDGFWYILSSLTGSITATQFGTGTLFATPDVPVPGDYDGDGKVDIAVWRPSDGYWYVIPSSTGIPTWTQFGTGTIFAQPDVPVPGDYDGDGKTDYAIWRPSDGNWYIIPSSTGIATMTQWGALGDIPLR